jgi:excisionase family DNA binding protein
MQDSLLDVAEAAQRLGVSERWVRRAIAERRLPFVKIGRHVRFDPADLDEYTRRNRVPAAGTAA